MRTGSTALDVSVSLTYLDNLHELIHAGVPGEDGLAQHQLSKHAPSRPEEIILQVLIHIKGHNWAVASIK